MERARELGRSLLLKARTGNESSEEEKDRPQHQRRSWGEVVSSSPTKVDRNMSNGGAGKALSTADTTREDRRVTSPGMTGSPQRVFSADDVAKLIELARKQLRKEKEDNTGWKDVETKEAKIKEKTYVKGLLDVFTRSPELEVTCWQCNKKWHIS